MKYRIKPGSLRVDIPYKEVLMSAEVDTVPADPIHILPVTNTVSWGSFIHHLYEIRKPDGRLARAGNTVISNGGLDELPLSGVRNGDPGLTGRESRLEIEAGDSVTVYRQRVPVVSWSRIESSTFYKRWSEEFNSTDPQTQYPPPQPNAGTDRAAVADPTTGVARITHTADPHFFSGAGGTVEWVIPAEGTLVAGYTVNDLTIEVDWEPGQHEIRYIATDTGYGLASDPLQRAFRNVFVKGTGFSPFSEIANITAIEADRTDLLGRSMTMVVQVDRNTDISAYLYTGATVLLTYQVQEKSAGGSWTNQSGSVTTFKGYLSEIGPARRVGGVVTYRLKIENPLLYFRRLGIASQVLQSVDPPTNWLEVHSNLAHLAFVIYYILEWNAPSLVQYVDIDFGDFESYTFPEFSFRSGTLTTTAQAAAGYRALGNIGCLSDGTIVMRDHVSLMDSAGRTALGSAYTWTARKIRGEISYDRNPIPRYNRYRGAAFIVGGDTVIEHEMNLLAPGYGADAGQMPDFLALSTLEASKIVGRMGAHENRPTETASWTAQGMIDVTDPAEMQPHTMNVASYDPLDCGIYENRVLPVSVERIWKMTRRIPGSSIDIFDPRFDVQITAEPETDGPAAPERTDPELGDVISQEFTQTFDFTASDGGWALVKIGGGSDGAFYDTGIGWSWICGTGFEAGKAWRVVDIYKTFAETRITYIGIIGTLTDGTTDDGSQRQLATLDNIDDYGMTATALATQSFDNTSGGAVLFEWTGSQLMTVIQAFLASHRGTDSPAACDGDPLMTSIVVRGIEPNPFI